MMQNQGNASLDPSTEKLLMQACDQGDTRTAIAVLRSHNLLELRFTPVFQYNWTHTH